MSRFINSYFVFWSIYFFVGVISFFVVIPRVYAADVIFKVVPDEGGTGNFVEVRIDPKGKEVNVVEGIVGIKSLKSDAIKSVEIEKGGSVLRYWPNQPEYFSNEKVVRFAGGVINGFKDNSLLFRIRILTNEVDTLTISWFGGTAYLNDGQATKENIFSRSITFGSSEQSFDVVHIEQYDDKSPRFDALEIGRDPSLYDGKYFVSFHAIDDLSNIVRYEIVEGDETTVSFDGNYVLKSQNPKTRLVITAYDSAGNRKTVVFPPRNTLVKRVILSVVILVLFFVVRYVYKKHRKK